MEEGWQSGEWLEKVDSVHQLKAFSFFFFWIVYLIINPLDVEINLG